MLAILSLKKVLIILHQMISKQGEVLDDNDTDDGEIQFSSYREIEISTREYRSPNGGTSGGLVEIELESTILSGSSPHSKRRKRERHVSFADGSDGGGDNSGSRVGRDGGGDDDRILRQLIDASEQHDGTRGTRKRDGNVFASRHSTSSILDSRSSSSSSSSGDSSSTMAENVNADDDDDYGDRNLCEKDTNLSYIDDSNPYHDHEHYS